MSYLIKIIGNTDYALTTDNTIVCLNNGVNIPEETEDSVFISLFNGPKKWYKKNWLMLVSCYNLQPPKGYEEVIDYFKIIDKPANYRSLDNHIVTLEQPVYNKIKTDFRMIARYPNYFINNKGDIYDNDKSEILRVKKTKGLYLRISLKDQSGRTRFASCATHRLVALAWLPNNDFKTKPILDHIDGDKTNPAVDNLRWVSYKENADLAFEQGLKRHNVPLIIRNVKTKEITNVKSIKEAANFIGKSLSRVSLNAILLNKLWKGNNGDFEIKLVNDVTKWKYEDNKDLYNVHCATSIIDITIDGKTERYNNWREVKLKVLNVKPESSYTIPMILDKIKRRYPNSKVVYKEIKGVTATNGTETLEAETTFEMANKLGIPKSAVIEGAATGKIYRGWLFEKRIVEKVMT